MSVLSQEDLRKAQLLQLKILKELHRICEKNKIKYFLSDGTLLGAIRHKGFIPWDDDIDVSLLREEYDKLESICQDELREEFFWQTRYTDPGYSHAFGRIVLKNTLWKPADAEDQTRVSGIFIDIFPFDSVPKTFWLQYFQMKIYSIFSIAFGRRKKMKYTFPNSFRGIFFKLVTSLLAESSLSNHFFNEIIDCILKKFSYNPEYCVVSNFSGAYFTSQHRKEIYQDLVLCQFEDGEFYIPRNFHIVLSKLFGVDYMSLPPLNKRVSHSVQKFDFGHYAL